MERGCCWVTKGIVVLLIAEGCPGCGMWKEGRTVVDVATLRLSKLSSGGLRSMSRRTAAAPGAAGSAVGIRWACDVKSPADRARVMLVRSRCNDCSANLRSSSRKDSLVKGKFEVTASFS